MPADPFQIERHVEISPAGVRRIRQGHLWIYASDVTRDLEDASAPIVRVQDGSQRTLGFAFYSSRSQIRLRLLTRGEDPPTRELFDRRVGEAIARRRFACEPRAACRLVYGEADLLPSIIVDRYGDYLAIQTLSSGADEVKQALLDALEARVKPRGIIERNDVKARHLEGLEMLRGVARGDVPESVEIVEDGIAFLVDLAGGQKTGFFLDQRENRAAAAGYARGRALDCFTNTGAFALHFARRCDAVVAVDVSQPSLEQARRNAERNGARNVEFHEGNAFDVLREMDRAGERFDLVCLDPPAFAKNRKALEGARAGYKEINLRAMKVLGPDGILVTSSCSYHLSEGEFFRILAEAAHDVNRYIQVLERRSQANDHPVLASMPETHYLKCFILRAL